jgi:hypothetical protein
MERNEIQRWRSHQEVKQMQEEVEGQEKNEKSEREIQIEKGGGEMDDGDHQGRAEVELMLQNRGQCLLRVL